MVRLFWVVVVVWGCACQTYDFERVVPLAVAQTTDTTIVASRRLKPNVMLLLDNSGSMYFPADDKDPDCGLADGGVCGGADRCNPAVCPTRVSEMKRAMNTFLQTSGTVARLGLTVFPTRGGAVNGVNGCDPSSNVAEPFPPPTRDDEGTDAVLQSTADRINVEIQKQDPLGGTPTGGSLEFVGSLGGLNDADDFRGDYVLLLTDGLPNCNGANANNQCGCGMSCSAAQSMTCNCKTGSCVGTDAVRGLCSKGCLDQDATVQKVKELRQRGISTIVVGFGADLTGGDGPTVLNAMAREGGFARGCPMGTNAECGTNGTCDAAKKVCATSFFQAATADELSEALRKIVDAFPGDPCEYTLSATPSDPRYLSVLIDGKSTQSGADTWVYDYGTNKVTFQGAMCQALRASTPQAPIKVEFRIVERF